MRPLPKPLQHIGAGVYDMISLRMAAAMGFEALCMTGYGAVASLLGSPTPSSPVMPTLVGRVRGAQALRGALGAVQLPPTRPGALHVLPALTATALPSLIRVKKGPHPRPLPFLKP
jgi:hypothetical protein